MKHVTDPALLEQLNATPGQAAAPSGLKPVTDPDLLRDIEAAPADRRSLTGESVFGTQLPRPQVGPAPPSSLETLDDTIRMLADDMTLRKTGEIAAGLNTLLGIGEGKTFEENLAIEDQRDAAIREREPGGALAAGIVGGVMAAIPTGGLVTAGAKSTGGLIARSTGAGAIAGAVAGAEGNTIRERLTGALIGTTIGAGLGFGIPLTVVGVKGAINRFIGNTAKGQARFGAAKIRQALERDEITPDEAFRRLQELGPEGLLVDVGENVRGLGRAVSGQPGRGKKIAVDVLEARQEGQGARLTEAVNEALDPTGDFAGSASALQEVRKATAKPLYDAAYAKKIVPNERLISLFRRPALERAWQRARTIAANEGEVLPDKLFITRPDGGKVVNPDAIRDVKTLDFIKRGLDDLVETKRDPITGKIQGEVAKGVNVLRKQYIAVLDELSPRYKAARAAWSGPSRSLEMMDRGRRFVNADQEITAGQLLKMTGDEKFFFRMGAARQLRDTIFNTPDGTNAVRRIFGSELKRQRLRAVFPDNESFNTFRKTMEQETELFRTRATVSPRSGSQTDLRAAERDDLAIEAGAAVRDLATGNPGNAAVRFMKGLFGVQVRMTPKQAETLARTLFSNDPETNRKIINALVLSRQLSVLGKAAVGTGVVEGAGQVAPAAAEFFTPGR